MSFNPVPWGPHSKVPFQIPQHPLRAIQTELNNSTSDGTTTPHLDESRLKQDGTEYEPDSLHVM